MFTARLCKALASRVVWRYRLPRYRFVREKGNLAFLGMLGLPILGVLSIVCLAYRDGLSSEPALIAVQQEAPYVRRRADDLQCLAENIYFEARGEPLNGQYAVAEVTLNRVHSRNFPHTICQVVHEAHWDPNRGRFVADFSWTELGTASTEDGPAWKQALAVANAVYDDSHAPIVPGALFYHAADVRPGWSRSKRPIATIGHHIFYR